jgi:subtilisin family serine protease
MKFSKPAVAIGVTTFLAVTISLFIAEPWTGSSVLPSKTLGHGDARNVMSEEVATATSRSDDLEVGSPDPQVERSPTDGSLAPAHRVVSGVSVRERLGEVEVLETKNSTLPDGSIRRSRLLKITGKYPHVVFEGILPNGDPQAADETLINQVAKVADHLLVRPVADLNVEAFRAALADAGLSDAEELTADGSWMVRLPDTRLGVLDSALAMLESNQHLAYAEPDFLIFPSDIPSGNVPLEVQGGVLVRPDSNLPFDADATKSAATFNPSILAASAEQRLSDFPIGTRSLTFDAPTFIGGPSNYDPSLEEQNFVISTRGGVYVQGAYTPGYPNNGSYYARKLAKETLTIEHNEGLPFTLHAIDASEYSTLFAQPTALTFVGHKMDGSKVTQLFTSDGVIDGIGSLEDFETFTLNNSFNNLKKVVIGVATGMMFDNIAVQVEEPESPAPVPPAFPLVYDVTFDAPKHKVGSLTSVSGPFAPSSINFGTPTVQSSIGTLDGPALELKGDGYQQIRFGLSRGAGVYCLEFDAYLDLPGDLTLHFDKLDGVQAIYFKPNGTISTYQDAAPTGKATNNGMGVYPLKQRFRARVDLDITNATWEVSVDGVSQFKRQLYTADGDLGDIRFHASATGGRVAGVDNIQISAIPSDSVPIPGPRMTVSPAVLAFPTLSVGESRTWYPTLTNRGTDTLHISEVVSDSSQFAIPSSIAIDLLPGGFISVPVTFAPASSGTQEGKITIRSDDPTDPEFVLFMSGKGVAAPSITLAPRTLDVTMAEGSIGSRDFLLGNTGGTSLSWNLVLEGATVQPGDPAVSSLTPDDASFGAQWALGQPAPGQGGIDAAHAWDVTTGSQSVVVAVIDTGIDGTHPDLQGNLWTNSGEILGNGIDDDRNGLVDDFYGWDFGNNDEDPTDVHGHGTHVAGTIGAKGDNQVGVTGVCWNVRIMPVKFFSDAGPGYTSDAVKAINYATRMGAKISNNSWGSNGASQSLSDVIAQAGTTGALFVAAAGNDSYNNDYYPHYPASFPLTNIVSVASTDQMDALSYFSNFGASSVDLAAPGSSILSLRPGGNYGLASGTSMASPHVAGVAALLLSKNPALSPSEMKQLLLFGSDSLATLGNKVASQSRLNASTALRSTLPTWLRPGFTSGYVGGGQTRTIPLTVDTTSLAVDTYQQTIVLSSNDPFRPSLRLPVILHVVGDDGYTKWARSSFATGNMLANELESTVWSELSDADGDGVRNLVEYVIGTDPNVGNTESPISITSDGQNHFFEFQARSGDPNVAYVVEWSENLDHGWRTDRIEVVEDSTAGLPPGMHRLKVKISGERPAKAFFRLAVSRNR